MTFILLELGRILAAITCSYLESKSKNSDLITPNILEFQEWLGNYATFLSSHWTRVDLEKLNHYIYVKSNDREDDHGRRLVRKLKWNSVLSLCFELRTISYKYLYTLVFSVFCRKSVVWHRNTSFLRYSASMSYSVWIFLDFISVAIQNNILIKHVDRLLLVQIFAIAPIFSDEKTNWAVI